jgi:hypothetical protein
MSVYTTTVRGGEDDRGDLTKIMIRLNLSPSTPSPMGVYTLIKKKRKFSSYKEI